MNIKGGGGGGVRGEGEGGCTHRSLNERSLLRNLDYKSSNPCEDCAREPPFPRPIAQHLLDRLIEQEPKEELESNPHKKLSRLSTLTNLAPEPAPEYLILLKSHKSVSKILLVFSVFNFKRVHHIQCPLRIRYALYLGNAQGFLKPIPSQIHCSLDRAQYVFLMKLQQEIQSFVDKIVLAVAQVISELVWL